MADARTKAQAARFAAIAEADPRMREIFEEIVRDYETTAAAQARLVELAREARSGNVQVLRPIQIGGDVLDN